MVIHGFKGESLEPNASLMLCGSDDELVWNPTNMVFHWVTPEAVTCTDCKAKMKETTT